MCFRSRVFRFAVRIDPAQNKRSGRAKYRYRAAGLTLEGLHRCSMLDNRKAGAVKLQGGFL